MADRAESIHAVERTASIAKLADAGTQYPLVYIGKHLKEPIYYFWSIKDGMGRFLRFGFDPFYPFWIGGVNTGATHMVPDKLMPIDCPKEAWEEVQLFIRGKVQYVVEPKRRGRKEKVIRSFVDEEKDRGIGATPRGEFGRDAIPQTESSPIQGPISSTGGSPNEVKSSRRGRKPQRGRDDGNAGLSAGPSGQDKSTVTKTGPNVKRGRRTAPVPEVVVKEPVSAVKEVKANKVKKQQPVNVELEDAPLSPPKRRRSRTKT